MTAPRKDGKKDNDTGSTVNAVEGATEAASETKSAPAKAKRERITQNGIVRPGVDSATGKVWAHADRISGETKEPAQRADVLKACEADEINSSTAATQYGRWCKFNGVVKPKATKKEAKAKDAPTKSAKETKEEDSFEE